MFFFITLLNKAKKTKFDSSWTRKKGIMPLQIIMLSLPHKSEKNGLKPLPCCKANRWMRTERTIQKFKLDFVVSRNVESGKHPRHNLLWQLDMKKIRPIMRQSPPDRMFFYHYFKQSKNNKIWRFLDKKRNWENTKIPIQIIMQSLPHSSRNGLQHLPMSYVEASVYWLNYPPLVWHILMDMESWLPHKVQSMYGTSFVTLGFSVNAIAYSFIVVLVISWKRR